MKKDHVEVVVGSFLVVGLACMAYISIELGQVDLFNRGYYTLKASFTSVTGLRKDTPVEISGVKVGTVTSIELKNYQAIVSMNVDKEIEVQDDAIASIRTKGLLGQQYIEILPGASDEILTDGGEIFDTEPPINMIALIKNMVIDKE